MFSSMKVETLEDISKNLVKDLPKDFADCIKWARLLFQEYYHNQIAQLLHNFPPDQVCVNCTLIKVYYITFIIRLSCIPFVYHALL